MSFQLEGFYESIRSQRSGFRADGCVAFLVIVKKGAAAGISLKRAVFAVVLSLYAGFGSVYVNNAAHVGGLLSGFLLGFLLSIIPPVFRKKGFSHEKMIVFSVKLQTERFRPIRCMKTTASA